MHVANRHADSREIRRMHCRSLVGAPSGEAAAGEHLFIDYETLASRYIATLSRSSSGGALRLAQS
jgi:hypothetical protein